MQPMNNRGRRHASGQRPSEAPPSIGCYVKDSSAREFNVARPSEARRARKRPPRYGRLVLLFGLIALGGIVIGFQRHATAEFKWVDEIKGFGERALALIKFPIEQVHIVGHRQTKEKAIIASLGDIWDSSVVSLNTLAAQKRIEKLPWVRRAVVERVFPHGINIYVEERAPIGRWATLNGLFVFDKDGTVIEKVKAGSYRKLPIFDGKGAPGRADELQVMLTHFKDLKPFFARYSRVDERRWTLVLKSGMEVLLPETQVEMALARLRELQAQHNILNRQLALVDLRLTDRVTLRPKNKSNMKVLTDSDDDASDESEAAVRGSFDKRLTDARTNRQDVVLPITAGAVKNGI